MTRDCQVHRYDIEQDVWISAPSLPKIEARKSDIFDWLH